MSFNFMASIIKLSEINRRHVHSKGDQSWVFIGRTDAKAEAPILWTPDAKRRVIGKDSDAGKV